MNWRGLGSLTETMKGSICEKTSEEQNSVIPFCLFHFSTYLYMHCMKGEIMKVTESVLNNMKGGDRIYPKKNKDDWYAKIAFGVYEGRFQSHLTETIYTADRLVEKFGKTECEVVRRKNLLLKDFYDEDEDTYTIPMKWMTECWLEVLEKLRIPEDRDGYRYYLYADGSDYILTPIALEFE